MALWFLAFLFGRARHISYESRPMSSYGVW